MTTRRVAGAAFLVLIMLVCLPAFHSATGLHAFGGAVDAFDQGVRVPETITDAAFIGGAIVLLLAASGRRVNGLAAASRALARSGPPAPVRRSSAHALRRAGASGDDSCAADGDASSGCPYVPLFSRPLASLRGSGGSSVAREQGLRASVLLGALIPIRIIDRTKRKGVSNAFQA